MTEPTPYIIASAQASQRKWRVPASVTIAQWALESGWGAHQSGKFNYGAPRGSQRRGEKRIAGKRRRAFHRQSTGPRVCGGSFASEAA